MPPHGRRGRPGGRPRPQRGVGRGRGRRDRRASPSASTSAIPTRCEAPSTPRRPSWEASPSSTTTPAPSAFNKLHEIDLAEWDRVLRVNLTGVWAGIRAAVPHMLAGGGGSIVSTASISGTRPAAGESPYAASKAAVAALTASAALEYGPIHPGQRGVAGHDPDRHDRADVRVHAQPGGALREGDAGRPDRRARGHRRRGRVPLLGPGPLRDRAEHRRGRRADPARLGRRRHLRPRVPGESRTTATNRGVRRPDVQAFGSKRAR